MFASYRGMKMCHLLSDQFSRQGHNELLSMVDRIGVKRKWIQNEGTYLEHFDICLTKRKLAIRCGAREIEYGRELAVILEKKRKSALR